MKLEHIVVCIDFSAPSESALKEAERIAARENADLTALHVIDSNVVEEGRLTIPGFSEGDAVDRAQVYLDEWIERTAGSSLSVKTKIALGHPMEEIVNAIEACHADLLVMGSRGVSHDKEVTGFTAAKCVRKAPSRVLLVREGHVGAYKKIVACVDFSDTSDRAIEHAVHLAEQDGATLELLHIQQPLLHGLVGMEYLYPKAVRAGGSEFTKRDLRSKINGRLDLYADRARNLDVSISTIEDINIGNGVNRRLIDSGADLVVLGTRGRTGLKRALMGTVAEKVVHGSPCSVLAIKPEGFTYHHVTA